MWPWKSIFNNPRFFFFLHELERQICNYFIHKEILISFGHIFTSMLNYKKKEWVWLDAAISNLNAQNKFSAFQSLFKSRNYFERSTRTDVSKSTPCMIRKLNSQGNSLICVNNIWGYLCVCLCQERYSHLSFKFGATQFSSLDLRYPVGGAKNKLTLSPLQRS